LNRIEKRIANHLEHISEIAEMVETFGAAHGCPKPAINEVNVALDEILSNIINYGYDKGAVGEILVRLCFEPQIILVKVEDAAKPFDPTQAPLPELGVPLHTRKIGGLGIHFVKTLMDEIVYTRIHGKNQLKLKKRLHSL